MVFLAFHRICVKAQITKNVCKRYAYKRLVDIFLKPPNSESQSSLRALQQKQHVMFSNNSNNKPPQPQGKAHTQRLAAFDFDYTIVGQNTDTVVRNLLPREAIPKSLDELVEKGGWTQYMGEIFRLLHQQHITAERIRETVRYIPEVPGMVNCLRALQQQHYDLIIISDSNSVFIEEWLRAHGVADCIAAIYTNPAQFSAEGMLSIQPYHHQTECRMSAPNLCKGKVLEHYVMQRDLRDNVKYATVVYVGDGNNDICPVLRLRSVDVACARKGFGMERNLAKNSHKLKLAAQLLHWEDGFDLLRQLQVVTTGTTGAN